MKVFSIVLAVSLLVASATASQFIVLDNTLIRSVVNTTGEASTIATDTPAAALTAAPTTLPALTQAGLALSADGTLYVSDAANHVVRKYDTTVNPATGSNFVGTSGTAGEADGTGTAATFNNPGPMVWYGGNLYVASNGAGAKIRKVTPAGLTSAHATPGAAVTSLAAAADGTMYAALAGKIVKISPDGATVSDFVGAAAGTPAAGVGVAAVLGADNYIALSKDGKTMYVVSNEAVSLVASTGVSFATVNMENQAVAIVTAKPAADGASADGVGSNAILSAVMGATVDSAGNVIFTERGATGGTIRKYEPATMTFSTLSSTAILAGTASNVVTTPNPFPGTLNNGAAETAKFVFPTAIISATSFCGKLAPEGTPVEITAACSELKGDVSSVSITGTEVTVSEPLNVAGDASVNPGAKLTLTAATAIAGALGLTGNGTFTVGGAAVTANSFAMAADSTYRILVEAATPAKLTVANAADLAGTVVVLVGKDFDFNVGSSVSIMSFASKTGDFVQQFLVKLRTPFSRRALLQAPNVNVACGNTNCQATGVAPGTDDDDEVPFLVALIIVSIALFVLICAAVFFYAASANKSGKTVARTVDGPLYSDYSSSSSEFFGPAADFDYDYYSY